MKTFNTIILALATAAAFVTASPVASNEVDTRSLARQNDAIDITARSLVGQIKQRRQSSNETVSGGGIQARQSNSTSNAAEGESEKFRLRRQSNSTASIEDEDEDEED